MALVLLRHTVLADAAGVGAAEKLQGPLVALAGPPLDVPQRLHQPVVLKLCVLQVRPEVSLAVGHQACEAGLEGPAGVLDTGVAHHIVGAQRFLLHLLFFDLLCLFLLLLRRLGILGLLQILLDLGLLGGLGVRLIFALDHRSFSLRPVLFRAVRFRLVGALQALRTSFTLVLEAGAADGVTAGCWLVSAQGT